MGFFVTTLIFILVGVIASLCARLCCNRGPSANLWAIVYLAQMKPLIVPILNESE
ncbi:V-type proton ATPase subunit e1 [Orobanche gracilis]